MTEYTRIEFWCDNHDVGWVRITHHGKELNFNHIQNPQVYKLLETACEGKPHKDEDPYDAEIHEVYWLDNIIQGKGGL
jgi:hypothetical protein